MINPCLAFLFVPATLAGVVLAHAWYHTWKENRKPIANRTIATAAAEQDELWQKLSAEDETAIEPPLPQDEAFGIDKTPMRDFEDDDRSELQALMLTKAIATWLEEESCQFPTEGEIAVRTIAQSLRQNGLSVLEKADDA